MCDNSVAIAYGSDDAVCFPGNVLRMQIDTYAHFAYAGARSDVRFDLVSDTSPRSAELGSRGLLCIKCR